MRGPAVEASSVWKGFRGHIVLRGVSLQVPRGSLAYLLGPNGAGKTTLIRVLLGLYKPDKGLVRLLGEDPRGPGRRALLERIGYVPENADLPPRLTGWEYLVFQARLYRPRAWRGLAERGARLTGLSMSDLRRKAGEYSRGMRRRVLLAAALMREPELLVLDEPFSGVDVLSAYRMKRLLKSLAGRGVTVLATSHNILEAEKLADTVFFIYSGRIIYSGSVQGALDRYGAESLEEAFARAVGGEG